MLTTVSEPQCNCQDAAVRLMTYSNGAKVPVRQCLACGRNLGAVPKSNVNCAVLAAFDENLRLQWDAQWREHREVRRAALEGERRARGSQWWLEYQQYLESPEWQRKSRLVLARDHHECQAHLSICERVATMAHHLTYAHLRNEPLFDLVSVCHTCHSQLHPGEES